MSCKHDGSQKQRARLLFDLGVNSDLARCQRFRKHVYIVGVVPPTTYGQFITINRAPITREVKMVIAKAVQVMHLASTLSVLSLALFAYERSVEPLYGSTPTGFYLPHFILASIALAFSAPVLSVQTSQFIFGISLCAVPITAHRVAVLTGRHGDATWGPIITHLLVLAPIFYSGSSIHRNVSSLKCIINLIFAVIHE